MNGQQSLAFELAAPALDEFLPAVESSISGILEDFGLEEDCGKELAGEVMRGLSSCLPDHCDIKCSIRINGKESEIKIQCKPPLDLSKAVEILNTSKNMSTCRTTAEEAGTVISIRLRLPDPEAD